MRTSQLLKEIKGTFVLPKKIYYFGRIKFHTPYFLPLNFNSTILNFRKLKLKSEEELEKCAEQYSHLRNVAKFKNLPMVRRNKDCIFKMFGSYYWFSVGFPFCIHNLSLAWKEKHSSVRHEWNPAFYIFFFGYQFCIHWTSPDGNDDAYYEQIIWWLYFSDKDLTKAVDTWGWVDYKTQKSTWKSEYLINKVNGK